MKPVVVVHLAPIPARKPNSPKGKEIGTARETAVATASEVMQDSHPLHDVFIKWCGDKQPTKRKSREFCRLMGISKAA